MNGRAHRSLSNSLTCTDSVSESINYVLPGEVTTAGELEATWSYCAGFVLAQGLLLSDTRMGGLTTKNPDLLMLGGLTLRKRIPLCAQSYHS